MGENNLPKYVQYLLRPDSYPHPVDDIRLVETHISYVVIAGDYVYKWKKTVDWGFLDFSTLVKRKFYCERELLLNRRLCPDVYLSVVSIGRQGSSYCLNGDSGVVEYGVKMIRLPEDRMMIPVMEKGFLSRGEIEKIVEKLVPFYERAEGDGRVKKFGTASAVAENVLNNLRQIEPYIDGSILTQRQFKDIRDFTVNFLDRGELFDQRLQAGRIRDCHGDLHAGNICLADKVYIFDCIEFSDRLRCGDVAADVAFLAMDLDLHGQNQLSSFFIERFVDESGDSQLLEMLAFYKCYRACVRGKINLLTALSPTLATGGVPRCREQARQCFALAASYVPDSMMKDGRRCN
jgi:uncharacterized protein